MSDVTSVVKRCKKCGIEKQPTEFHADRRRQDGRTSDCKSCACQRATDWYLANRDRVEVKQGRAEASARFQRKRMANPDLLAMQREATRLWRLNNADRIAQTYRMWQQANPDKNKQKHRRRQKLLSMAFVETVRNAEIWERDKGICQLCSEPIDPALEWPHRYSKSIDHVIPLSRGGTHEPANVQLAHLVCNCRKQDRLA